MIHSAEIMYLYNCPAGHVSFDQFAACPGCLVQHSTDTAKCHSCGAARIQGQACLKCNAPSVFLLKHCPPPGDWYCSRCGAKNHREKEKCGCCWQLR